MQEIANKMNKIERSWLSNLPMPVFDADARLKVTSCKGMSGTGSLLQILQQAITLHVRLIRPGLQLGFWRGVSSLSGKKGDPCYGSMVKVSFPRYWRVLSPDKLVV
jgi:hypothetical protein